MRIANTITAIVMLATACSGAPPQTATAQSERALGELDRSLRNLAAKVNEAVVQVVARGAATPGSDGAIAATGGQIGSGVFVSNDGLILTNAHVVVGASRIEVVVSPRRDRARAGRSILGTAPEQHFAHVVGIDLETDLALLKVELPATPFLRFSDSDRVVRGQFVLAFGSPLGLGGSASIGVVSARARQLTPESPMVYIQTDAAINPGSSGGPLVDLEGRIVGINAMIASKSGGSDGLGFAIPSNIARSVYRQLRDEGEVTRGVIGAVVQTIDSDLAEGLGLPQAWGVVVSDVLPGGPAYEAGLEPGDVIVSLRDRVNDAEKLMENARQFNVNIYRYRVGDEVRLKVRDGGGVREVTVAVAERADALARLLLSANPEENRISRLDVIGFDLDPNTARQLAGLRSTQGVLVVGAGTAGPLVPGDVIVRLNGSPTSSIRRIESELESVPVGAPLVLTVERGGVMQFVAVDE